MHLMIKWSHAILRSFSRYGQLVFRVRLVRMNRCLTARSLLEHLLLIVLLASQAIIHILIVGHFLTKLALLLHYHLMRNTVRLLNQFLLVKGSLGRSVLRSELIKMVLMKVLLLLSMMRLLILWGSFD